MSNRGFAPPRGLPMMISLILPSLVIGLGLSGLTQLSGRAPLQATLVSGGFLLIALMQMGVPPLPPISSKHKLVYLLLLICIAAPLVSKRPRSIRVIATAAILTIAFLWLNWRRLFGALPAETVALCALTLVAVLIGVSRANRPGDSRFLWPVSLCVTVLGTGLVGLFGGYLGLGQLALGCAAALGGLLLLPYGAVWLTPPKRTIRIPEAVTWSVLSTFGLLGMSLASFATNLHPGAFGLLLLSLVSPIAAARTPQMASIRITPILYGAIAAIPAGGAVLLAFFNF